MNEKLQSILDNLDLIRQLNSGEEEVVVSLLDRDGIVLGCSAPASIPQSVAVGERFNDPTGAFDMVINTGKTKHNILPKEVVGIAMEGNLVPVKDGGVVVGCIISTYSVEAKAQRMDVIDEFKGQVQEISGALQEITEGMQTLFERLTQMDEMTADVERDVNGATDVVNKVSGNASRSNILALNASIEAARSGDAGRGFAVVAKEMGKLASESGTSASEIKSTLNVIGQHLHGIIDSIKETNGIAQQYIESIENVNAIVERAQELAERLG